MDRSLNVFSGLLKNCLNQWWDLLYGKKKNRGTTDSSANLSSLPQRQRKIAWFLFYLYTLKKERKLSSVQCIDIVWLGNAIIYFVSIAQRSIIFAEVWFNRIFQNGYVEFGMRVKIFFPNFSSLILITDAVNKRSCLDKMKDWGESVECPECSLCQHTSQTSWRMCWG